jgi:hypothetical protein
MVRSAATGQPISGAVVSLDRAFFVFQGSVKSDTTGPNGQYHIEYEAGCEENGDLYKAPGDAYLLVTRSSGYQDQSNINISMPILCISGVQTVNFNLTPQD